MASVLTWIGSVSRRSYLGQLLELGVKSSLCVFGGKANRKQNFQQMVGQTYFTGVEAIPLVAFLALVLGSATILQAVTVMPKIGATDYFGNVMVVVIVREIGPLFTAFLVAGRTGSALSTFLGNMKVQQEIDALTAMGVDPVRFLVFPAFVATIVSLFCLTVVFNLTAIIGGFFVVQILGVVIPDFAGMQLPLALYMDRIISSMGIMDGVLAILKPLFFGAIIALVSCYHGISVSNDIRDVPKATTKGVVNSFVFIVLCDSIMAIPFLAQLEIL